MSRLVVMGSGETAPTMARIHRELMAATPPGQAVMLDTPFAFQMNRDELVARTRLYFAQSVGREVDVVRWPPAAGDPAAGERSLALLDSATWVFAGPGSPTYALRCWRDTPVPAALTAVVRRGGTLVMGSAAAVTLGSHAVPVYEIYKVGADPVWEQGLDLLGGLTGLAAAVLPHYDNREGGTHDTRFCYLGELRLAALEHQLPDEVGVLGVDEHTAAVIDVAGASVRVLGNGRLSVRRRGVTTTCAPGSDIPLPRLDRLLGGDENGSVAPAVPVGQGEPADIPEVAPSSVREDADRARSAFDAALARGDTPGSVAAVLALESAIAAWRADTWQSGELEDARRVLRALVVRLGDLAQAGARDPGEVVGPYLDLLLELRRSARDRKDFTTSDLVRDRLVGLGVEVRDTAEGSSWRLPPV
ncbi:MAG: hypothetical protein H0U35_13865 [Sporichthyaceae bacterium]|nr:hypothetical protein [Sporichthyaceae bacterium]